MAKEACYLKQNTDKIGIVIIQAQFRVSGAGSGIVSYGVCGFGSRHKNWHLAGTKGVLYRDNVHIF